MVPNEWLERIMNASKTRNISFRNSESPEHAGSDLRKDSRGGFKPYPAYKDSGVEWLGEVPVGWVVSRYKYWVTIKNGADYKDVECEHSEFPVIGSGGAFAYATKHLYCGPAILLGRKGTIDRPLFILGRFWTVDTMYSCLPKNKYCPKFIYYACLTIPFNALTTNTALPSMTQEVLGNISFATPPLPEQEKIAAFLEFETGRMDVLIQKQERLIELLKEKRQAVISHAVTKGLPSTTSTSSGITSGSGQGDPAVPMRDSGIEWLGEVPAHWVVGCLKYFSTIITGYAFSSDEFIDDGVPVLRIGDITKEGEVDFAGAKYLPKDYQNYIRNVGVKNGDVVMAMTGATVGKVGKYKFDYPALLNQRVCIFRPKSNFQNDYLWWYLNTNLYVEYVALNAAGGAQPNISDTQLLNCISIHPPQTEQKIISEYLNEQMKRINRALVTAKQAITLIRERRTALISAAVTGKIDVREWEPKAVYSEASQPEELRMVAEEGAGYGE
jgi:type I restriction enzyme, S subunit